MRITEKDLRERVAWLHELGFDISIQWAYGKPRIYDAKGGRELSPRLPTGQLWNWLDGYDTGREAQAAREEASP